VKVALMIGAGSFLGGMFRYGLAQFVQFKVMSAFPWGTLTVNILGCLLIGIVYGLTDRGSITQEARLFLATGVLGGFTTYSAFSVEMLGLLRDGQFWSLGAYASTTVLIGLAATFVGNSITKLF